MPAVGRRPRRRLGHRPRGPSPQNGGRRLRRGRLLEARGRLPHPGSLPRRRHRLHHPAHPHHPPAPRRRCVMPFQKHKALRGGCPVAGLLMGCGLQCGACLLLSSSNQRGKGLLVALLQIRPRRGMQHQLIGRGAH